MSDREAWLWMIARASWADTSHKVGSELVPVPRGAFFCTLRELQSAWMWGSDTRVRNFLKRLETALMIRCEIVAKGNSQKTQISLCNYEQFQNIERTGNAEGNARETHGKRIKGTKEQVNKEEANASSAKNPRATRLSADWFLPRSWGEWAVNEGYSQDVIRTEAENFKDYWHSKAGPAASKLDWEATWRIWVRKAPKGKPNGKHDNAAFGAAIHQLADRLAEGTARIDTSNRDPFAVIRGGNAEADPDRVKRLL